jgi:hypothetical protein
MSTSFSLSACFPLLSVNAIDFLWAKMQEPKIYGLFHVISLILTLLLCVFVVIIRKKITKKALTHILLTVWIIVVVFELLKQINFSYSPDTDEWKYLWYAFPFQLCSSMIYVLPFAIFIKSERVRSFAYSFLMSYNLLAGLFVMFYPATVFIEYTVINLQTMLHHGLMVVVAVLLYSVRAVKINYRLLFRAAAVFCSLLLVAVILNSVFIEKENFNMFFIDSESSTHEFLSSLFVLVPQPVYTFLYAVVLSVGAAIITLITSLILHFAEKKKGKAPSSSILRGYFKDFIS